CFVVSSKTEHLSVCPVATQPSRSTFYPYTTLFRSQEGQHSGRRASGGTRDRVQSRDRLTRHPREGSIAAPQQSGGGLRASASGEDRKSTRLNSSHVKNSYAVFCLKKKSRRRTMTPK